MKVKRELCDAPASKCITLMRCDVRDRSVPRRVREAIQMLRAIERRHRQLRPREAEAGLFEKKGGGT